MILKKNLPFFLPLSWFNFTYQIGQAIIQIPFISNPFDISDFIE